MVFWFSVIAIAAFRWRFVWVVIWLVCGLFLGCSVIVYGLYCVVLVWPVCFVDGRVWYVVFWFVLFACGF